MAQPIYAKSVEIIDDEDKKSPEDYESSTDKFEPLAQWVVEQVDRWRTWRDTNYAAKWDEYEALWRGIWRSSERMRETERSKIVAPALSEAVENAAAELEEAIFGRGAEYFDIQPYDVPEKAPQPSPMAGAVGATGAPMGPLPAGMPPGAPGFPQNGPMQPGMGMIGPEMGPPAVDPAEKLRSDVEKVRMNLKEDLGRGDFASESAKAILYSAVFGTGFGEIVVKPVKSRKIAVGADGSPVKKDEKLSLGHMQAVSPRNCVVDPTARSIDDGLGVAIEELVGKHVILRQQKDGALRKEVDVCEGGAAEDDTLEGDQIDDASANTEDKVHVIRYYGLVPTRLLYPEMTDAEEDRAEGEVDVSTDDDADEGAEDDEEDGNYTEAVVVIGNKRACLKAESSPYVLGDRPVVIFPWDIVPGRLHGRGICEKGASSQKMLDAEIRARMDSLALVTAPMMGMDVNRIPRGLKFSIKPGGSVLTNGKPSDVMEPFKFGQLDPNHWQNAASLQAMVQQATGSVDAAALAGSSANARPGAVSMMMAPVIKRYKRTMIHFVDLFLVPALEKIAIRNMQFAPDRYPTVPAHFKAASTMGIMQREYETSQMTTLMASMDPSKPEHRALLTGIVSNSTIPNREKVLDLLDSAEEREKVALAMAALQQEDPATKQKKEQILALEMQIKMAEARKMMAEAKLAEAKAQAIPMELQIDMATAATKGMSNVPGGQQDDEFDRRMQVMDRVLEGKKIEEKAEDRKSNERIAFTQMAVSASTAKAKQNNG